MNTTRSYAGGVGSRPPFTPSQWQELEHQALIFKYLMAGLPVPPELVIPIKKSFESMPMPRFFHHPSMGYCSFYGKKEDPEPGRCRRTDGKKWRCSKDAYPDSKYCERHMHRGRNRSRKPVETQTITLPPPHSSSSTVTASGSSSSSSSAGCGGSSSFQNLPLHSLGNPPQGMLSNNPSQLQMDPISYRYHPGMKQEADEQSFLSDPSGNAKGLGMESSQGSTWNLMPSRVSSLTQSKTRSDSMLQAGYSQMHPLQGIGHASDSSTMSKQTQQQQQQQQQQQHCFFGGEYGVAAAAEPLKQEGQSLRPFFDEWPKTRDAWSELEDDRSNRTSFSTTQLSISIPLASSDFSGTSSQSLNDD